MTVSYNINNNISVTDFTVKTKNNIVVNNSKNKNIVLPDIIIKAKVSYVLSNYR